MRIYTRVLHPWYYLFPTNEIQVKLKLIKLSKRLILKKIVLQFVKL